MPFLYYRLGLEGHRIMFIFKGLGLKLLNNLEGLCSWDM
jgi:hypothetical protein